MKYKIKNLVVRNIKPFVSSICLIGTSIVATNSFGSYKVKEPVEINISDLNTTKSRQDEMYEQFVLESKEFLYKASPLTEEQIKENYNNNYKISFDLDDMIADAPNRMEKLSEQRKQEYIDGLITIYENGYDYISDIEIDTENFELTTDNKTYEYLDDSDFEFFVACVAAECNGNTHDALATASSILNRCDSEKWQTVSEDPVGHLTAGGQYSVYSSGLYEQFLGFNVTDEVLEACTIVWYDGIRNNNYCSFRANHETYYDGVQVVDGGNRFADELKEEEKTNKKTR